MTPSHQATLLAIFIFAVCRPFLAQLPSGANMSGATGTPVTTLVEGTYYPTVVADGNYSTGAGTDNAGAINDAIAAASANPPQAGIVQLPCGFIRVNSAINMTNTPGIQLRGCGAMAVEPLGRFTAILCETGAQKGAVCVDTTGSSLMRIQDITLVMKVAYPHSSTVGILQGRDDARGGGLGAYCFESGTRISNFTIFTDANPTLNRGHGFVGIANTGAENGAVDHFQINANTPVVHDAGNSLGLFASPYQNLAAHCPVSVTGVSYRDGAVVTNVGIGGNGFLFHGSAQLEIDNIAFIGGGGAASSNFAIYMSSGVSHLTVTNSGAEQFTGTQSNLIGYTADLDHIYISMAGDSKAADSGAYVQPLANNLTCQACEFDIFDYGAATPALFGNTFSGQKLLGGRIVWTSGTSFSMSNWTVQDVIVQTPYLNSSSITFGQASNVYWESAGNTHEFIGPITAHDGLAILANRGLKFEEGSAPIAASASEICYGDAATHSIKCSYDRGPFLTVPQVIARGTSMLGSSSISGGACATASDGSARGVAATDVITWSYSGFPAPSSDGRLILSAWASSGAVNFTLCNPTAGSITPSGLWVNWRVVR